MSSGSVDLLVCGGGMAGLCAAMEALQQGASVTVIEKAPEPGGSMRMSGGTLWTGDSLEAMLRWVPEGDPIRMGLVVSKLQSGLDWLESLGISCTPLAPSAGRQGSSVDPEQVTAVLTERIVAAGGRILCNTALESLLPGDLPSASRALGAGERTEWVVVCRGENSVQIRSKAVILATGGFQANRDLVLQHITPHLGRLLLRSNPHSTGDGLMAALGVGSRTSPALSSFYGHTMPVLPANPPPDQWTRLTQYYSQHCVLVNEQGERFCDESISKGDECVPQLIAVQPGGRAFLILDHKLYTSVVPAGYVIRDKFDMARQAGHAVLIADSLDELARRLSEQDVMPYEDAMAVMAGEDRPEVWGVDGERFLATMTEYNRAVTEGRAHELSVPRQRLAQALETPPYYAMAVRAGITFTLGGIDIDEACRVIGHEGSPIPGLYAAGGDAGGTYHNGYMGGLALGLVQGRIAGQQAIIR